MVDISIGKNLFDIFDVAQDIICVSSCSKGLRSNLGALMVERAFPLSPRETVYVNIFGKDALYGMNGSGVGEPATAGGEVPPVARMDIKVPVLKEMCRTLQVPVSGKKSELVERVRKSYSDWMRRTSGGRDATTGLLFCTIEECKIRAQRSLKRTRSEVERSYALSSSDYDAESTRPPTRRRASALAVAKYGSLQGLEKEIDRREQLRLETRQERRAQLSSALTARRPWLTLRSDSALCSAYIEGTSELSLERVVDATEEIQFLYRHTNYSSILRGMRYESRYMDREFGSISYWRKREMVREGLIEYIDDDTPDCSDIEEEKEQEEREEEERRRDAKKKAIRLWISGQKANAVDDQWKETLPRSLQCLVKCM